MREIFKNIIRGDKRICNEIILSGLISPNTNVNLKDLTMREDPEEVH